MLSAGAPVAGAQFFGLTQRQEIELGREAAAQIERQMPILHDATIEAYIDQLGQSLVEYSGRGNIEYRFKIVNTEDINAFALPGGFIYVHRGLIEAADNESELAGVLAHEISHVVERHSSDQIKRAQITGLGLSVLDVLVGGKGAKGDIANMAGQMVATGTFMKYSRDAEREADRVGAENLYDAGYDPKGMITFFEKLEALRESKPNAIENFFASHPSPDERVDNVSELVASFPPDENLIEDSQEFHDIQVRLMKKPVPNRRRR
jgi:predicted Zn-dependent protease